MTNSPETNRVARSMFFNLIFQKRKYKSHNNKYKFNKSHIFQNKFDIRLPGEKSLFFTKKHQACSSTSYLGRDITDDVLIFCFNVEFFNLSV